MFRVLPLSPRSCRPPERPPGRWTGGTWGRSSGTKVGWGTQTVLLAEPPTADETRSTGCLWRERALGRPPGQGAPRGQEPGASSARKRLGRWGPMGRRARGSFARAAWPGGEGEPVSRRGTQERSQKWGENERRDSSHRSLEGEEDIRRLAERGKGRTGEETH